MIVVVYRFGSICQAQGPMRNLRVLTWLDSIKSINLTWQYYEY